MNTSKVELVGAIWRRRDGSTFTVERADSRYVWYWLADGSRPQFRSVAVERLEADYVRLCRACHCDRSGHDKWNRFCAAWAEHEFDFSIRPAALVPIARNPTKNLLKTGQNSL